MLGFVLRCLQLSASLTEELLVDAFLKSNTFPLNDVCKSPHPNTDASYVFPWSRNDTYWRITL